MIHKAYVLAPVFSLYNVQHHFARKIYEALSRKLPSCELLEGDDRFRRFIEERPDFSLCFNGAVKFGDKDFLCDVLKVPHVACLIDPPFHFMNLLKSAYMIITCDDRVSCELLHVLGFPRTFFMPHGVEKDLAPNRGEERPYDIVMLATFIDCEKRRKSWRRKAPKAIWQGMEEASERALSVEKISFITAMMDAFFPRWKEGIFDREKFYKMAGQKVFEEVELYIKGRDRLDLIESIQEDTVHVFGDSIDSLGWKKYFKKKSNVIVHPPVSYEEAEKVMKQSKIVLNSCIKNAYGAHERVFAAAACGAAVVTNENDFLCENFTDGKEMILYQRTDFSHVNDSVHGLLLDEKKRRKMAGVARKKVMTHHTWDHRVDTLLTQITPLIEKMKE